MTNDTGSPSTIVWEDTREVTRRFEAAVRDALGEHKRAGNPVAVWRDGRVIIVPPEEIPGDEENSNGEVSATPTPQEER